MSVQKQFCCKVSFPADEILTGTARQRKCHTVPVSFREDDSAQGIVRWIIETQVR
jgi:hypothetical protein